MRHVEQDLLTLLEQLRSPLVFGGVRVDCSLVFNVVSIVLLFVCLSFSLLSMALLVYLNKQTIEHMTQHRKLKNKQNEPHQKLGVISCVPEG